MLKEDVEKQRIKDEADVFCDNDQVDAIMKDMNNVLMAMKEWHEDVIYFCEKGINITCLCAGYSVQLIMDVFCKILDDYKKIGVAMRLKKEHVKFIEQLGDEQ